MHTTIYLHFLTNVLNLSQILTYFENKTLSYVRSSLLPINLTQILVYILAQTSILRDSSPYTQDAETGRVISFWIVHKDQVKPDIELCLQSNCAHKVGSSPAMEPCGAKTSLGGSYPPLEHIFFSKSIFCLDIAQNFGDRS